MRVLYRETEGTKPFPLRVLGEDDDGEALRDAEDKRFLAGGAWHEEEDRWLRHVTGPYRIRHTVEALDDGSVAQAKRFLAALDGLTDAIESEGEWSPLFRLVDGLRTTRAQVSTNLAALGVEEPYGGWS